MTLDALTGLIMLLVLLGAIFIGVPIVLALVAFLAAWIPARRASRVDPIRALRYE